MTQLLRGCFRSLICILAMSGALAADGAGEILNRLTAKMDRARDYTVQATIRPEIPMITIQPTTATLYFKQKDKFRMVASGIALLPKQGFMDVARLLSNRTQYTPVLGAVETLQSKKVQLITLLPLNDTADIILAKLWIESGTDLVLKAQITTRSSGTATVEYTYGSQREYALPDVIVFTVDIRKFKLPKGVASDINRTKAAEEAKKAGGPGKITVTLTDYKVNKGLSDDVFVK